MKPVAVTEALTARVDTDGNASSIPGCRLVTSKSSAQLRLHVEQHPDEHFAAALPKLDALCDAFQRATGWELRHEQSPGGLGEVWSTTIDGCGAMTLTSWPDR